MSVGSDAVLAGRGPTFDEFFEGFTGYRPYVWQRAAAEAILAGDPPASVTVPTGMGKTSLMLCWLWALCYEALRR